MFIGYHSVISMKMNTLQNALWKTLWKTYEKQEKNGKNVLTIDEVLVHLNDWNNKDEFITLKEEKKFYNMVQRIKRKFF